MFFKNHEKNQNKTFFFFLNSKENFKLRFAQKTKFFKKTKISFFFYVREYFKRKKHHFFKISKSTQN